MMKLEAPTLIALKTDVFDPSLGLQEQRYLRYLEIYLPDEIFNCELLHHQVTIS